ncbi:MAG: class IV adenylate cyclase, partial [Planctomycetota bacterium]
MGRNVEMKARLRDVERARVTAEKLSGGPGERIVQEDTFFNVPRGRLKLRNFGNGRGELIFYERADEAGPRESNYFIHSASKPDRLRALLEAVFGARGVVRKVRTLHIAGRTRIHLDDVEGLGDFLEIEVVLAPNEAAETGRAEAERLLGEFGIDA